MGGTFLSKYLSENNFPKNISALFLLAPAFDSVDSEESMGDFVLGGLEKVNEQVDKIILYHSTDDAVVSFKDADKFVKALKTVELKTYTDRGHFRQEHFPELINDIKSLE